MDTFTIAPTAQVEVTTPTVSELVSSVKDAALAAINDLVAHHVKGADLLQKGFTQLCDVSTEVSDWYEILKNLLHALQPFFGLIEAWLKDAYAHLVDVFNWAKEMWHKLFSK